MDLFDDLKNQGEIYRQLDRKALIKNPFSRSMLQEMIDQGLLETSEDANRCISSDHEKRTIFMIHLDSSQSSLIEVLKEAYEPFKKHTAAYYCFEFLLIDTNQKNVFGIGLGRRGRVFSMISHDGAAFIECGTDSNERAFVSTPHDLIGLTEKILEELGQAFLTQDNMPFDLQSLQQALDGGPNENGDYLIEDTEENLSEEEIVNLIEDYEIAMNAVDKANQFFQIIFENISIELINKGDF
jgi:hypothetical protein